MLTLIIAISLLFGIPLAAAGNLLVAKYFVLFASLMTLVFAFGIVTRPDRLGGPMTAVTASDRDVPATRIRYSTPQFVLLVAVMSNCAVFCLTAAVEIYVNLDDGAFPAASIIIGALGLFCASFLVTVASRRVRSGELLMSTRGVTHRGWSFESRLDWSSIASITQAYNGCRRILLIGHGNANWHRRYTTRLWRIEKLPTVPMIELDYRRFDVDANALYAYLSYYVETPAARAELGTEAAIIRAHD